MPTHSSVCKLKLTVSAQLPVDKFFFSLFELSESHTLNSVHFFEKHGYSTFVSVTQNIIEYLHFGLSLEILISFNVATL